MENNSLKWSKISERHGAIYGLRLLLFIYKKLGKTVFRIIFYPVIFCYWFTGKKQRTASRDYLRRLKKYADKRAIPLPDGLTSFRHFIVFSESILDKLLSWTGELTREDLELSSLAHQLELEESSKGILILCSHLGNIEITRALSHINRKHRIHALVYTEHAEAFNEVLQSINPDSGVNLIQVASITPETIIFLKNRLDCGDWVAIVGDRIAPSDYHRSKEEPVIWSDFLGNPAPFPKGPFILASLLKVPTYLMFSLKRGRGYKVYFEDFKVSLHLERGKRDEGLQLMVNYFASRLEFYCLKSPLAWFNFYDFWYLPSKRLRRSEINRKESYETSD